MFFYGVIRLASLWVVFGGRHGGTVSLEPRCGLDEYRCEDGQCVKTRFVCDGIIQCKDGSDESTCESLSLKLLPRNGFLRRISRQSGNQPFPTCRVPPQPKHGRWQLDDHFCLGEANCNIPQGVFVPRNYELFYSCDSLFRIKGYARVVCQSSGNWTAIPECIDEAEVKCASLNSASTAATCYRDNEEVNCDGPVLYGTNADVTCKAGYKEDIRSSSRRRDYVTCGTDGEWYPKPIKCTPVCGIITPRRKLSASNTTTPSLEELPWHANLYKEVRLGGLSKKKFVCGATIIHTKLILTAAHCVYDPRTRSSSNPSQFYVLAGNVVKEYDSPSHDSKIVYKSMVRNVYIHCPYHHERGSYEADIALLELYDPFEFSDVLKPACLDVSGTNNQILGPGAFGMYSSFGISKPGTSSEILKTSTIPWISNAECRAAHRGADDVSLITDDKFCAGSEIGTIVCEENRGSGLVFQKRARWYLMGVATVGFSNAMANGKCDKQSYTLYTKVANHIEWIQNVLYALKYSTHTTPCDSHCSQLSSTSTTATCLLSGNWTTCDSLVPPNTKAKVSCRTGYMMANWTNGQVHTECKTNGRWDPEPMKCVLDINESPSEPHRASSTSRTRQTLSEQVNALKSDEIPDFADMEASNPTILDLLRFGKTQSTKVGTIAERKCAEYAEYASKISGREGRECRNVQASNEIGVSGSAKPKEFPYMAAFGFKNGSVPFTWFCFGSLVSENFVISTVACVPNEVRKFTWIRVGSSNLSQDSSGPHDQYRRITKIIPHPDWSPPAFYHSIALFKMESPVVFSNWVLPACLHTRREIETPTVIRTGWNYVADLDRMQNYVNIRTLLILRQVKLNIVDQQRCNASLYRPVFPDPQDRRISKFLRGLPRGIVDDWIICVDNPRGLVTEINGAANPIVIPSAESACMYELVGVTMFNSKLTLRNNPGFTRISNYVSWLEKTIWLDG